MVLEKGRVTQALNDRRYERDNGMITEFMLYKEAELKNLQEQRDKTHQEYMAMKELQDLILEANKYLEEIEVMHVDHTFLNI